MPNIGMNLWVTAASDQGGRKYMEDVFDVKFDRKSEDDDARYAYFGVFDGHGGPEAARFAKKHLLAEITKNEGFWCEDDDEMVLNAISEGFKSTHNMMWNAVGTWPLTASGYPSTSGCTATVLFIRHSKMYLGHVGDSGVVLGTQEEGEVLADYLTEDHKPENYHELSRIVDSGGGVMKKAGVHRVVWERPRKPCKGPLRRSTLIDHIPFLAVSRALGDLWSYNSDNGKFIVSPEPDVRCMKLDPSQHKTIVLASDGLWHIMNPQDVIDLTQKAKKDSALQEDCDNSKTPASALVQEALQLWQKRSWRADNISVIVVEMDHPESDSSDEAEDPTAHLATRASSASTIILNEDDNANLNEEDVQNYNANRVGDCPDDDLPRSTTNTPITGQAAPSTPLEKCVANKQPFSFLFRGKMLQAFDGDDQDSRDTVVFGKLKQNQDHPKWHSPTSSDNEAGPDNPSAGPSNVNCPNTNNSASMSQSPHLKQRNRKLPSQSASNEDQNTSEQSISQQKINRPRDSIDGACCSKGDQMDKNSGASQAMSPSASQVHGASSGHSKVTSPRSARQVGLNLTNSTSQSSSLNRRPLETPHGWTSIKGADSDQQVTACSAMGSEIAAGNWPDSLDLGTSSEPVTTDAPVSCYGACEYAPENPPCKKCNPPRLTKLSKLSRATLKKAVKRKASPPIAIPQLTKRFRSNSCAGGGHRTRSTLNRIKAFHSRSSRKAAST